MEPGERADSLGRRIKSGDEDAFDEFYAWQGPYTLGHCMKKLGHYQDAQEAVNDVYMKIWCKRHLWDPCKGSYLGWTGRIVTNCIIDRYRWRQAHGRGSAEELRAEEYRADYNHMAGGIYDSHTVLDALIAEDHEEIMQAAAARMRPKHREAFSARFDRGEGPSETSKRTGMPHNTAKVYLVRARQELQKEYRRVAEQLA